MSAKAKQRGQSWPQIFNPNHLDQLYTRFRNPDVAIYITLQPERMYGEYLQIKSTILEMIIPGPFYNPGIRD